MKLSIFGFKIEFPWRREQRVAQPTAPSDAESPSPFTTEQMRQFDHGGKYRGAYTEVARRLTVSPTLTRAVARGDVISARVLLALRKFMAERDVEVAPAAPPQISDAERLEFRPCGKYHGCYSVVARRLGIHRSTVAAVISSRRASPQMLGCLREVIAERDAEIATGANPRFAPKAQPITELERLEFGRRGRYYGVCSEVGRRLQLDRSSVAHVATGRRRSQHILKCLREVMAERDAVGGVR